MRLFPQTASDYFNILILRRAARLFKFASVQRCLDARLEYDAGDGLWRGDRAGRGPGQILRPLERYAIRIAKELIGATLAFALLCGLAAALRNFIQQRLTRSEFH